MKFHAVSTFNREGLELYGNRMIESFNKNWPEEVGKLTVYAEGWDRVGHDIRIVDLLETVPWLTKFKEKHANRRFRDYRWDAVKFAHKVAAVCHAASTTQADILIWLDGDIITHSPIKLEDLRKLAPVSNEWISWLDRRRLHPECGFYMLNCKHPSHQGLIDYFVQLYTEDKLFKLRETHDSFVLQHVVRSTKTWAKSLSGDGVKTSHPMINGPLGQWFDHLKGERKKEGKSRERDLKVKRVEEYWA